jgi:HEAT repeat protein
MFSDDAVWPRTKRAALEAVLGAVEQIPEETLAELRPIAASLASKTRDDWADPFDTEKDLRGPATCIAVATDAVDHEQATDLLLDLLAGGPGHRRWAAELARRRHNGEDLGLLLGMTTDQDPSARSAAAMALAWLVGRSLGGTTAVRALERCLEDPGTQVPASIAATLVDSQPRPADGDRLLARLRDHPSAVVRGYVVNGEVSDE